MWENVAHTLAESFERVAIEAARVAPGALAMLALAALSLGAAWAAGRITARALARLGFDRRFEVAETPPSRTAGRCAFWLVLAGGLAVSVGAIDTPLTNVLARRVLAYLPGALAALLILFAGMAIARFVERTVLIEAVNRQIEAARVLALGARWLVVLFAAAMALEHLAIGGVLVIVSFSILFGGIALALALAVGLGARDVVGRALERRIEQQERRRESIRELARM